MSVEMPLGGAAVIDITPSPGLLMTGYVARTEAAIGTHDPLTVRAVVYAGYAIVVADVIGIHEDMSRRIRDEACLPAENIIIAALHNHGAPASMSGRLAEPSDAAFLEHLEQACIDSIASATACARPCRLHAGEGRAPGIAVNRRHQDGPVDDSLPVVELIDDHDVTVAMIVSYACHPVVLGADNILYTADYPHYVRQQLEQNKPGSIALFITGAIADANTGHSAHDSVTLASSNKRTFSEAQRIGEHIARCAQDAVMTEAGIQATMVSQTITLDSHRTEKACGAALAALWRDELALAEGSRAELLRCWINWAETIATEPLQGLDVRVSVLNWGGILFVALPGEIFASTAHDIRAILSHALSESEFESSKPSIAASCIVGFADTNPGYIPPESEFEFGGYEIDEAHRYYGRPATFAPDSVDRLLQAVTRCVARL